VQDKVWVHGPDAEPWEIYTVLADAPVMQPVDGGCCSSSADDAPAADGGATVASCC